MNTGKQLAGLLLLSTALSFPVLAHAQDAGTETVATPAPQTQEPAAAEEQAAEDPEVSIPGGAIIVTGRISRDPSRGSAQVLSVLSAEQIAKTGEGNIAGALGRVTGLSVVGSGFVYVRGLGDRYSLALLNGSPLPSPEPLRRVVPLDLFPTGVIASSLVQKSYSANYPGEFGGGVINLTTRAIPTHSFLTVGVSGTWDTEATNQLGYTYFGSSTDWTGFDDGSRNNPPALAAFIASGKRISAGDVDTGAIAAQLVNTSNSLVQKIGHLPANFSGSFSSGTSFDVGDNRLGVILGGGYSNKWTNRDAINQSSTSADLSSLDSDFRRVTTDNRLVMNGLVGLGYEFGDNTIRWTNLYIHDTIKHTRMSEGVKDRGNADFLQQETAWYERQLIDTQLVGEFKPVDDLSIDLRGGYANSQRHAPQELSFEYVRTNGLLDPTGGYFVNRLNRTSGSGSVSYSDLNEDLWSGGADVTYRFDDQITATVGGAWSDTQRTSTRRGFLFDAPITMPAGIGLMRPDHLLAPAVVDFYNIGLIEDDESTPSFLAKLTNWAGYGKLNVQVVSDFGLEVGIRYEKADQSVTPVQVFSTPSGSTASTALNNEYWLPAATMTWEAMPDLQLRASISKTIARPQFRELIYQPFYDPDSNRVYLGNPLLQDSQLYNAELRGEYYFAAGQRFSLSAFYKRIDNPIETFVTQLGGAFTTSFANAPKAQLYGAELELQKNFDLNGGFWPAGEQVAVVANYTYTKSQLQVSPSDLVHVFASSSGIATDFFQDGAPLTGQSDHIANVQLGLENQDHLSQQTFMLTYASDRVISRGLNGSPPQPDVIERPGFRLDFIARQGFTVFGRELEAKVEARNILGRKHEEFQQAGATRINVNTYDVGPTFTGSLSLTF
ncbi:MAG: hypothetical protein RLZZ08_242 [Pseudomonadota bacterium]|jgi:outer membrane receptor protein involved in Fe transport